MDDENPHSSNPSGSHGTLSVRTPATKAQILARIVSLELLYGRQPMTDSERRIWLETYCEDLKGRADDEIGNACKRYRQDAKNRYFPTPGQLLELLKNPYEDPPTAHKGDKLWERLGFGGGSCQCPRCVEKKHRDGFYVAPPDDYLNAETVRGSLKEWTARQITPSRLDDAEMDLRSLMVNDLVRGGMGYEHARRKVMVERTKALYPEFKIWPELPLE